MPVIINEMDTQIESPSDGGASRGIGSESASSAVEPEPEEIEQAMRRQSERAARLRAH